MSEKMRRLKRSFGLFLFWVSWLLWGVMLLVPLLLDADLTTMTVTATVLLVAAEVSFALSILLLGRPFYHAVKARVKALWGRISLNRG